MKTNLTLISTWLASNPTTVRAVSMGVLLALTLAVGLVPQEVAIAGPATGGSH
jgi:hypothetical protein